LGYYGGSEGPSDGVYAMDINGKTIIPRQGDPWSIFRYMNQYIWDDRHNNVILVDPGTFYLTKPVRRGEELYVHYGQAYNPAWIPLRRSNETELLSIAIELTKHSPPSKHHRPTTINTRTNAYRYKTTPT
jgi:hypothetical protein